MMSADGMLGNEDLRGSSTAALGVPSAAEVTFDAKPQTTVAQPSDIDPPPNGGTVAWLQVLGSFFLFWNSWLDLHYFFAGKQHAFSHYSYTVAVTCWSPSTNARYCFFTGESLTHSASSRHIMRPVRSIILNMKLRI